MMEILLLCFTLLQVSYAVFVQTQYGWVEGVENEEALAFYGIPYAQQPERWGHAVPPVPWGGVLSASKPRPMCLQPSCGNIDPPGVCQELMSENCHFINVFIPLNAKQGNRKSVMVFIHGGDFTSMSGGAPAFNGEHFVNKGDVILVTFNYRLGALGFLVTDEITGNFGITDQRLALQWVYNNIDRFGGSRTNVTLFGHGTGATSVAIHMSSQKSIGLFRNAIIQSLPFSIPLKTSVQARTQGQNFSLILECTDTDCLRSKSPWEILDAQEKGMYSGTFLQRLRPWGPHLDENEVPVDIQRAFRYGLVHDIPLLIGTTTSDGADLVFKTYQEPLNRLAFSTILTMMNPSQARFWYTLYSPLSSSETRLELTQFISDFVYICPTRSVAQDMARVNNTWVYAFGRSMDFLSGSIYSPHCAVSACHGSDLAYLFQNVKNLGFNYTMPDMQLSDELLIYWTNFAKLNNPNGDLDTSESGMFEWYQYRGVPPAIRAVLGIGHPQSSIQTDYRGSICNMFGRNNFSS